METEIRTSPELNPQLAALRCPGCMVSLWREVEGASILFLSALLIGCGNRSDVDCMSSSQCRNRRIYSRKLMKRIELCLYGN